MKRGNYKPDSEEVLAILKNTFRHGNRGYHRVNEDGNCEVYPIRTRLMALGMGSTAASAILEQACIPQGRFILNPVTKQVRRIKADIEVYELGENDEPPIELDSLQSLSSSEEMQDEVEDIDEEEEPSVAEEPAAIGKATARAAKAAEAQAKHYELVRQGSYHGIYNKDSASTELFHTEAEAVEYLYMLLHGYEGFYHGIPSREEAQPINCND